MLAPLISKSEWNPFYFMADQLCQKALSGPHNFNGIFAFFSPKLSAASKLTSLMVL